MNRLSLVLFFVFIIAGIAAIAWVDNEFNGSAPLWRYVLAVTDASGFLIAAVIARVGAALVQTLGRVRASLLDAILEQRYESTADLVDEFPETRVG
ncbi:MAG TPA: hypothetical protein VH986_13360 [Acidimicrobiia bacterium]